MRRGAEAKRRQGEGAIGRRGEGEHGNAEALRRAGNASRASNCRNVVGSPVKRSKDGDKLCRGVDAKPASVEVFRVAGDNTGRVSVRGRLMEHGILVVWEVQLERIDDDRVRDGGNGSAGDSATRRLGERERG
jgi:hypothetical protein